MFRHPLFFIILLSLLTSFAAPTCAEIRIESRPNPLQVHAADYQAQVDWDGCLTSLRLRGQEFLAANVSISRGTYFFYLGPVQPKGVTPSAQDTIVATGQ